MFIGLGVLAIVVMLWFVGLDGYRGEPVRVTVPREAGTSQVRDSLETHLGKSMGKRVYILWKLMGGTPSKAHGSYLVTRGGDGVKDSTKSVSRPADPRHGDIQQYTNHAATR